MPVKEIQREPLVNDDLSKYTGSWVAIRDGKVIASALDPVALRGRDGVLDTDALMPVPPDGQAAFIL